METKTILLKEFEGKRYEIHLCPDADNFIWSLDNVRCLHKGESIFRGTLNGLLQLENKEEIAERVVEEDEVPGAGQMLYKHYTDERYACHTAIRSLESAIGEYKYIVITETDI